MNDPSAAGASNEVDSQVELSIAAVERETGIAKDTLRVWERRYGFPNPTRNAQGERCYSMADLDKLRLIRRLSDHGYRPGRIAGKSLENLRVLASDLHRDVTWREGPGQADAPPEIEVMLSLLRRHDVAALRQALRSRVEELGLENFVTTVASPLSARVGVEWARGDLAVFEEHLFSEALQNEIRAAIVNLVPTPGAPHILLTTLPNEPHGLGLLMGEAVLALRGCQCVSLGPQTPIVDIVMAATAKRSDVVALSCSAAPPVGQTVAGIKALREQLPASMALWIGGKSPGLARRSLVGVSLLPEIRDIALAIQRWHIEHIDSSDRRAAS